MKHIRRLTIGLAIILWMLSPTLTSAQEDCPTTFYEDPQGRFTFPLLESWTAVETDGSYAQFTVADPAIELYVVTVEAEDLELGAVLALEQVDIDSVALSLLTILEEPVWTSFVYAGEDGLGVVVATQMIGDTLIALILIGDLSLMDAPPPEITTVFDGFFVLPSPAEDTQPVVPTSIEAIEDLDHIEFYSGGDRLTGRLTLPDGEGPFPAIVYVHGSGPSTRHEIDFAIPTLKAAGFAVFSYDKRGAGDSEGNYFDVGTLTSEVALEILADDALAAVNFLRNLDEINADQVGLTGISQAGWIIPLAATRSDAVAFTFIWVGPTISVGEEIYYSDELTGEGTIRESDIPALSQQLVEYDGCRGFDPRATLEAITVPGWWYFGGLDASIPTVESIAILESIIEEYDKDFTIWLDPQGTHSFPGDDIWDEAIAWILTHIEI